MLAVAGFLWFSLLIALDRKQKGLFIVNLLQEMKREGRIAPEGSDRWTRWRLHKTR